MGEFKRSKQRYRFLSNRYNKRKYKAKKRNAISKATQSFQAKFDVGNNRQLPSDFDIYGCIFNNLKKYKNEEKEQVLLMKPPGSMNVNFRTNVRKNGRNIAVHYMIEEVRKIREEKQGDVQVYMPICPKGRFHKKEMKRVAKLCKNVDAKLNCITDVAKVVD